MVAVRFVINNVLNLAVFGDDIPPFYGVGRHLRRVDHHHPVLVTTKLLLLPSNLVST